VKFNYREQKQMLFMRAKIQTGSEERKGRLRNSRLIPKAFKQTVGYDPRVARKSAFTLLELLVVITLIVILASLAVPALSRANNLGRTVVCANNLRQLGIATATYSLDNIGKLPDILSWVYARSGDLTTGYKTGDLTSGKLYPYLNNARVYLCPTDRLELDAKPGPFRPPRNFLSTTNSIRTCSYAINCFTCHVNDTSRYLAATRTLLFLETDMAPNDVSGLVGPKNYKGTSSAVTSRHNGTGHVMLCDSHIEKVKTATAECLQNSKLFWLPVPTDNDPTTLYFSNALPDP
jgi:prepilin-type N-terminal cleavage/methylation domain-containing protein